MRINGWRNKPSFSCKKACFFFIESSCWKNEWNPWYYKNVITFSKQNVTVANYFSSVVQCLGSYSGLWPLNFSLQLPTTNTQQYRIIHGTVAMLRMRLLRPYYNHYSFSLSFFFPISVRSFCRIIQIIVNWSEKMLFVCTQMRWSECDVYAVNKSHYNIE